MLVLIWYESGWAPEFAWTTWRRQNSWPYRDSNSDHSVVQSVVSRYSDYAIPTPADIAADYVNWCQQIGTHPTGVTLAVHYSYSVAMEQSVLTTLRTRLRRRHIDALFFIQVYFGSKFCTSILENDGLRVPTRYITVFVFFNVCSSSKDCPSARRTSAANNVWRDVDVEPKLFSLISFYSGSSFI
jgi:hypothetical protein